MFAALIAAALTTQFGPSLEPVRGVPGQPVLPVFGTVEQVPATEHYTPFGTMFEPVDRSRTPWAPRHHHQITTPTFVPATDLSQLRSPAGPHRSNAAPSRPDGFAARATVPNRPRSLREMRYGGGPVPGSAR